MRHLFSACAAVLASLLLVSCGGNPNDWDADSRSTAFVWRDEAFAEHPGVGHNTDPGVPSSRARILVGKRMTMTYRVEAVNYTIRATFTSPMICQVETNAIDNVQRTDTTASYLYEPLNDTEARLTIRFRSQATSCVCVMSLNFADALNAETTIHSFNSTADEEIVAPDTVTENATWLVVER